MTDPDQHQKREPPEGEAEAVSGEAETPPPEVARRRPSAGLVAMVAVIALAVLGAAALTQPPVRAWLAGALAPEGGGSDAALAARLERLETEIAALRAAPKPETQKPPAEDPRVADLEARLGSLAETVAKRDSDAVDPRRLARVEERLDAASSRLDTLAAAGKRAPDDRVALLAFVSALDSGRPFAMFLETARARVAAMGEGGKRLAEDLEALAPFAARGVPTSAALAARAGALRLVRAPAAAREAPAEPADAGLWARVREQIAGLVTIRRVDEADGTTGEGTQPDLASARAALAAGDLTAATATLETVDATALSEGARLALDGLRRDLAARHAAERLARALDAAIAAAPASPSTP